MRRMVLITLVACSAAVAIAVGLALVSESSAPSAGRCRRARSDAAATCARYGCAFPAGYRAASAVRGFVVVLRGAPTAADQLAAGGGTNAMQSGMDSLSGSRRRRVDEGYGGAGRALGAPRGGQGTGDAGAIAEMTTGGNRALAHRSQPRLRNWDLGRRVRGSDPWRRLSGPVRGDRHPFRSRVHGGRNQVRPPEPGRQPGQTPGRAPRFVNGRARPVMPVIVFTAKRPQGPVPVRPTGALAVAPAPTI